MFYPINPYRRAVCRPVTLPTTRNAPVIPAERAVTQGVHSKFVKGKAEHPQLYYVLTLVGGPGQPSRFFPMSQASLHRLMAAYEARPTIKFDARFSGFNWGDAMPFIDRWSELPLE